MRLANEVPSVKGLPDGRALEVRLYRGDRVFGMLFVIVDQTAEAANEDWVFPGRKRSGVGFAP